MTQDGFHGRPSPAASQPRADPGRQGRGTSTGIDAVPGPPPCAGRRDPGDRHRQVPAVAQRLASEQSLPGSPTAQNSRSEKQSRSPRRPGPSRTPRPRPGPPAGAGPAPGAARAAGRRASFTPRPWVHLQQALQDRQEGDRSRPGPGAPAARSTRKSSAQAVAQGGQGGLHRRSGPRELQGMEGQWPAPDGRGPARWRTPPTASSTAGTGTQGSERRLEGIGAQFASSDYHGAPEASMARVFTLEEGP